MLINVNLSKVVNIFTLIKFPLQFVWIYPNCYSFNNGQQNFLSVYPLIKIVLIVKYFVINVAKCKHSVLWLPVKYFVINVAKCKQSVIWLPVKYFVINVAKCKHSVIWLPYKVQNQNYLQQWKRSNLLWWLRVLADIRLLFFFFKIITGLQVYIGFENYE
jgi:hypothetical protein